jgi:hypothetical protein
MHTRNVYHKRGHILRGCDTPIILRNSKKSLSQMNHLSVPIVRCKHYTKLLFPEIYFLDSVQKIISNVTELLITIIHCLNQLPFCAIQPADGQTKVWKCHFRRSRDLAPTAWHQPWHGGTSRNSPFQIKCKHVKSGSRNILHPSKNNLECVPLTTKYFNVLPPKETQSSSEKR